MPFHSTSALLLFHLPFPVSSIFHIPLLSPFHDPLLVARFSDPYVVALCLGSPQSFLFGSPLQGMHPSTVLYLFNILWIPLASIQALCLIVRLPLQSRCEHCHNQASLHWTWVNMLELNHTFNPFGAQHPSLCVLICIVLTHRLLRCILPL